MAVNRNLSAVDQESQPYFRPAIVVMAKVPSAGSVKTRLRPFLTEIQCESLAVCFLHDIIANTLSIIDDVFVAYYPTDAGDSMVGFCDERATLIKQIGDDLGERLDAVVSEVGRRGFSPVLVIGSDSPTLPDSTVITAVNAFIEPAVDLILGPTEDGGYYLIGIREPVSYIFNRIDWSTERVYRQTIARAKEAGLDDIVELPPWYDVDVPADLIRLDRDVRSNSDSEKEIPETYRWLLGNRSLFE
ncbi:MAG: TIGR04282 family arsenosugar biosynthesis glycosyltransferase [Pyrinomonadaceae bacterium]